MKRYQRQMRLAIVGQEGQRALGAASVVVGAGGEEGAIAARYLVGAGVLRLRVSDATAADAARALDARAEVTIGDPSPSSSMTDLDDLDPAARDVARGARAAVRALVEILGTKQA